MGYIKSIAKAARTAAFTFAPVLLVVSALSTSSAPLFAGDYPITVRGASEASFAPKRKWRPIPEARADRKTYDVVIVGGGLAGLTAAVYLTDHGKRVLLVEKEPELGGLAFGGTQKNGIPFNRGAAYWTPPYEEELKILEHMGLGNYAEMNKISEPIDSYLWEGKLYEGVWEHHALEQLPASFKLFKFELQRADRSGLIPNQPFEEAAKTELDSLNGAEWVRLMPHTLATFLAVGKGDAKELAEGRAILTEFENDSRVLKGDPMRDVLKLLNVYARSAMGTTPDLLSAMAFANFYISEVDTRYSSPIGTGHAARVIAHLLEARKHLLTVQLGALATRIVEGKTGVSMTYVHEGFKRTARANYAVYAGQLKFAPKIVRDLDKRDPEKTAAIREMDYAHYMVHVVSTKGHPFRATYDTWLMPKDYTERDPTDVILGRWLDPAIRGFEGMRDFKVNPDDDNGIFTIYHPFHHDYQRGGSQAEATRPPTHGAASAETHAKEAASYAVDRMIQMMEPMMSEQYGTRFQITGVETNLWPYSIHVVSPRFFTKYGRILRRPVGRTFFANNNIGTPSFEEALFRGHCAANNILRRYNAKFPNEAWSRCPAE